MAEQPRKTGVYESGSTPTTTKKKGIPSWVWALVALAILALAALWYANQESDAPPPPPQSSSTTTTTPSTTTTTPPTGGTSDGTTGSSTPGAPARPAQ